MEEEKVSRRDSIKRNGSKKKYRILSQRKRKSCPVLFTADDKFTADHYLQLADMHHSSGSIETAAKYYSVILGRQMEDKFSMNNGCIHEIEKHDVNNNGNATENREVQNHFHQNNSEWYEEYLKTKFVNATDEIAMCTINPKGYLEKAAVLFFQNEWDEARKILETGMELCSGSRSVFTKTIEDMENILKYTRIDV